jgi:murein DD-endopeptidase MepM/ murein hydrolase activator NlpD
MRRFPVDGPTSFVNDWGVGKKDGRRHQGIDVFANEGTPLVAVDAGVVHFTIDPLGGVVAYLRGDGGTTYYYAHLQRVEGVDRRVSLGERIGYVGRTGNAAHTSPHLHFEVHPGGGAAINPHPLLVAARAATPARSSGGGLWLALPLAMAAGAVAVAVGTRRSAARPIAVAVGTRRSARR